jgi:hypothetical protein
MPGKDEGMNANDFGKLRSFLAQNGITQEQIREAVGNNPNGRTRGEIADQLRAWLATRPKAQAVKVHSAVAETDAAGVVVPIVRVFGREMPLSSKWTYTHIIQPLQRLVGRA